MTTFPRRPAVILLLLLFAAAAAVEALVFDVPSGSSKCLTEELRQGVLSHLSYRVVEATTAAASTVSARVTGPSSQELQLTEGIEVGRFRFETVEDGKYTACFWTPRYERGAVVSVGMQWATGIRANGRGSLPAASTSNELGRIRSIIGELKGMEESAKTIHEEMIFLRHSEGEIHRLKEDTAVRMHSFTLLSLAVCAGIAGLQLWYLKIFFQKRHILYKVKQNDVPC